MRIYLDNCCFNRPFDDQGQIRINLETQAKLFIQAKIELNEIELVWSYILEYENSFNPFEERQRVILYWKKKAVVDISENQQVLLNGQTFVDKGLKSKDALHVACAIEANCNYFLTTDDIILKKLKNYKQLMVLSPIDFVTILEH